MNHSPHSHACGSCGADAPPGGTPHEATPDVPGATTYRIPTMDCAAEEGEIRHALDKVPGLRSLTFRLSARTLTIDAPAEALPLALAAIRKIGFKPEPLANREGSADHASHDHQGHHHGHDHDHAPNTARWACPRGCLGTCWR